MAVSNEKVRAFSQSPTQKARRVPCLLSIATICRVAAPESLGIATLAPSYGSSLDAQVIQDAFGGGTTLEDRGHHQVGTPDHVATGEDLRVAGLVLELRLRGGDHAALVVDADVELLEPGCRART